MWLEHGWEGGGGVLPLLACRRDEWMSNSGTLACSVVGCRILGSEYVKLGALLGSVWSKLYCNARLRGLRWW